MNNGKNIEKIAQGIFRIKVPFEDLFTTVYVYKCDEGVALIDSATYSSDVETYIAPALKEVGIENVDYLLLTHDHGDHMGGINKLSEKFPNAIVGAFFETEFPKNKIIADGEMILGNLQVISLPGHTKNSVGYFDKKTKTLLSGDCLQLRGIVKYRGGICYHDLYENSCKKLKEMDIEKIIAAHEYDPLGSIAEGEKAVKEYVDKCIEISKEEKRK